MTSKLRSEREKEKKAKRWSPMISPSPCRFVSEAIWHHCGKCVSAASPWRRSARRLGCNYKQLFEFFFKTFSKRFEIRFFYFFRNLIAQSVFKTDLISMSNYKLNFHPWVSKHKPASQAFQELCPSGQSCGLGLKKACRLSKRWAPAVWFWGAWRGKCWFSLLP
jgi:hypothetical protein